jgi:glycerol kinase
MSGLVLGIDHGGSTTTAMLFEPGKGALATASVPMPKRMPRPDHVEHDPEDFVTSSLSACRKALEHARRNWADVAAIGIANQGETSMAWSSVSGQAVGPAISWEDRRTAGYCDGLAAHSVDRLVRERTGIRLDPYFSASKFHWLSHALDAGRETRAAQHLRLGGTDAFLIARLTAGETHATEPGSASRTALLDIRARDWDRDLLAAFDVDRIALPEIRDSLGDFGSVRHADIPAAGIRVTADAVDAHAALFAQGCWDRTIVKATYGTGAFINVSSGPQMLEPDGQLPVFVAWQLAGEASYTVEGSVFSVGSAIDWAVRTGWLPSAQASAELAFSVPDTAGVSFVPSFTGISAPHWRSHARAQLTGLGLDTTPAHIVRALLDGIAFSCVEVIRTLDQRLGGSLRLCRADGGPTRNAYLMQRQADLLGMPVMASDQADMTALGAAQLAAIGAGMLTLSDVRGMTPRARCYEPAISADQRDTEWAGWHRTMDRLLERTSS